MLPIVEGGKGIGVSSGKSSGAFAAASAVGTFSGVNADSYDENNNPKPITTTPAKPANSPKDKLLGRYTAILAASCISHTDHNVPLVIHCAMVQPNFASPTNFFFAQYHY